MTNKILMAGLLAATFLIPAQSEAAEAFATPAAANTNSSTGAAKLLANTSEFQRSSRRSNGQARNSNRGNGQARNTNRGNGQARSANRTNNQARSSNRSTRTTTTPRSNRNASSTRNVQRSDNNRRVNSRYDRNNNGRVDRRYDRNNDGRVDRRYRQSNQNTNRNYRRSNNPRWNNSWRNNNRYNWRNYRDRNSRIFRIGRYYSPYRHYNYRRPFIGFSLGSAFFGSRYWISDPWRYRLPAAYGPYRWVRYYDDVLLIDIRNGRVADAIHNFFW